MNLSYDYSELLTELKGDLAEGLVKENDKIKVVRGRKISDDYRPIIDYYYDDNPVHEPYSEMRVSEVIKEMEYMDRVIK